MPHSQIINYLLDRSGTGWNGKTVFARRTPTARIAQQFAAIPFLNISQWKLDANVSHKESTDQHRTIRTIRMIRIQSQTSITHTHCLSGPLIAGLLLSAFKWRASLNCSNGLATFRGFCWCQKCCFCQRIHPLQSKNPVCSLRLLVFLSNLRRLSVESPWSRHLNEPLRSANEAFANWIRYQTDSYQYNWIQ